MIFTAERVTAIGAALRCPLFQPGWPIMIDTVLLWWYHIS